MAENDDIITLRSEVESLRMAIFQLQSERGGAGGGGMGGGFFPIGDFAAGGAVAPSQPYPFKIRQKSFDKETSTFQLQIYLPSNEDILIYKNKAIDPMNSENISLEDDSDGYWRDLVIDAYEGVLYLKIVKDYDGNDKVVYYIGSSESGDGVVAIAYIGINWDLDGNGESTCIEQYVRSALHLGGEAGWKDPDPEYFQEEE